MKRLVSLSRLVFALGALAVLSVSAAAQTKISHADLKDPSVARDNALYLPGGGYFYTGEYVRGGVALGITGIGVYELVQEIGCTAASNSLLGADTGCSGTKKLLWLTASVAPYIYGIFDAPGSAARANKKLQQSRTSVLIEPGSAGTVRLGFLRSFR